MDRLWRSSRSIVDHTRRRNQAWLGILARPGDFDSEPQLPRCDSDELLNRLLLLPLLFPVFAEERRPAADDDE